MHLTTLCQPTARVAEGIVRGNARRILHCQWKAHDEFRLVALLCQILVLSVIQVAGPQLEAHTTASVVHDQAQLPCSQSQLKPGGGKELGDDEDRLNLTR